MKEKQELYAKILLENCIKIDKNQPLFITCPMEAIEFVRMVARKAYELGVTDIYFNLHDPIIKHDQLKYLDNEYLKPSPLWNKEIYNEYTKKGAAFLTLVSETPGLMSDIDPKKINEMSVYAFNTSKLYDEYRDKNDLTWCIAAVPTEEWAYKIFKEKNSIDKLWNKIFDICLINESNPSKEINKLMNDLEKRANKLNNYEFKYLKYTNSLGTNLTIELPKNHLWCSGESTLNNGKKVIVNFPTLEVFTSPVAKGTNGIVYNSKPLVYSGVLIDEFYIEFKDGKVINAHAKKGNDMLQQMITSTKNMDMLGEVALVPYDSKISNTNLLFYETLFDENASCHLALGASFQECLQNTENLNNKQEESQGLNKCDNHVDFMIGTKDLNIIGITSMQEEIQIFKDGNFYHI